MNEGYLPARVLVVALLEAEGDVEGFAQCVAFEEGDRNAGVLEQSTAPAYSRVVLHDSGILGILPLQPQTT